MVAKFKNRGRIDLFGQSNYFRYYVNRIVSINAEDIVGNYSIVCERYSRHDGYLLDESSIFSDENDKPFQTLREVADFIRRDAVDYWNEKEEATRINRIISNEQSLKEKNDEFQAKEKLVAWSMLLEKVENWLAENGEPIHSRFCNN